MDLLKENIPKLVRKLSVPAMVGTLFQTLYNVVDTFFAGKISPEALSALSKSFPIYFIIIAASIGVTVAGTSLIGNSIGEKDENKTLNYFTHINYYGIIISIIITFLGLSYAEKVFFLMGSTNEVVSLGGLESLVLGGQWSMSLEAREGHAWGDIVGSSFERSPSGDIVYSNGLPQIASGTKVLGNISPDWTGGANFTFSYKNLSLNALVDAKIGGDIYSMTTTWGRYAGVLEETMIGRETGIVGDGVMLVNGAYVPNNVVRTAEDFNKRAYSNSIVESSIFDASYVKLRQVMFSYKLPKKYIDKTLFSDINFSLVGRNLLILHKNAPHIDPESAFSDSNSNQGQEFGQLPSARSIGFNLQLKL